MFISQAVGLVVVFDVDYISERRSRVLQASQSVAVQPPP